MRTRSPSRTSRFGLACSPLTSILPPSQARFASERVLNRQATSSQTSRRRLSFTLLGSGCSVRVQVRFGVPGSGFHVRGSTFGVPRSEFHVRSSTFGVPRSEFHVPPVASQSFGGVRTSNVAPRTSRRRTRTRNSNRRTEPQEARTSDQDLDLPLRSQSLDEGFRLFFPVAVLQELLDLRAHVVERDRSRGLLLGHADDVIPELRLDQVAGRARLHAERRIVERTDHLALFEEAEVATVDGAARVLRVFL